MTANASNENGKLWASMALLVGVGIPGVALRLSGLSHDPGIHPALYALIFGIGIIGGAFLLSWAAEVAQLDVSASFAIAILALIAVMPEYMVEAALAWNAGASFNAQMPEVTEAMSLAAADVTGSNRLLIGIGWAAVIIIFWLKRRSSCDMRGLLNLELPMLAVAVVLTLIVAFFKVMPIWLAAVFIGAYIFYLWRSSTQESEEPDLLGAAAMIAAFRPLHRRLWMLGLFIYSAAVIILVAHPFVTALEATGEQLGISKFLLIQWLAPLASESPELIVAALFALRANPNNGLITLISSQVSQLTLLVGSIAVVFSISAGQPLSFPLDRYEPVNFFARIASPFGLQSSEFLLTAVVAIFAILIISTRIVKLWHGLALFAMFILYLGTLFWFPNLFGGARDIENVSLRVGSSLIIFGLAALLAALNWRRVVCVFRGAPRPEGHEHSQTSALRSPA